MENNLQIYTYDKNLTTDQNIKNFILKKIEVTRALKNMQKVMDIYEAEIREQEGKLHITKDGKALFISEMEDSHLINTVKLLLRSGRNFRSGKVKKYVDEVKKRGLVAEIINLDTDDTNNSEPFFEEDDFSEDRFNETKWN